MSSTNPRPDNYWPCSGFASDSDNINPRVWVPLALIMVLVFGGLYAFVLHRDESAPVAEVQNP